jgi:hypothetical protein
MNTTPAPSAPLTMIKHSLLLRFPAAIQLAVPSLPEEPLGHGMSLCQCGNEANHRCPIILLRLEAGFPISGIWHKIAKLNFIDLFFKLFFIWLKYL